MGDHAVAAVHVVAQAEGVGNLTPAREHAALMLHGGQFVATDAVAEEVVGTVRAKLRATIEAKVTSSSWVIPIESSLAVQPGSQPSLNPSAMMRTSSSLRMTIGSV